MEFNIRKIDTNYNELRQLVCQEFDVKERSLIIPLSTREVVDARKALSYLVRAYRVRMNTTDLGNEFGLNRSIISYYVKDALNMLDVDRKFNKRIDNIMEHLRMKSFSQADENYIDLLMGCIVWPEGAVEKGTTRDNFKKIIR